MKYLLFAFVISFFCESTRSQSCPLNIDFEEGNFKNWQCFIGKTFTRNGRNVIDLDTVQPRTGRHEIISADGNGLIPVDAFGGFPKLCPYGGKYSVMLGNT